MVVEGASTNLLTRGAPVLHTHSYHAGHMTTCLFLHADPDSNKIIATASLLIERKFIRSCGKVCHSTARLPQG